MWQQSNSMQGEDDHVEDVQDVQGQQPVDDSKLPRINLSILPDKLNVAVDKGEMFSIWKNKWEIFSEAVDLDQYSKRKQAAVLQF